jgi:hypothetical protein
MVFVFGIPYPTSNLDEGSGDVHHGMGLKGITYDERLSVLVINVATLEAGEV